MNNIYKQNRHLMPYSRTELIIVSLFFFFLLILGVNIFQDFGISIDEPTDNYTGLINAKYALNRISPSLITKFGLSDMPDLLTWRDRHYGAFFQMPAAILPNIFGYKDPREIYFFRHLLTFVFFLLGVLSFYFVIRLRLNNWRLALIGAIILVVSPRIFADAFYNNKDAVFLSLMVLGWWTMHKFRLHQNLKWAIFHGFVCAAALNTRIMALTLPGLTLLWATYEIFFSRASKFRILIFNVVYLLCFTGFLILLWPYLWENPLSHFLEVFNWLDRNGEEGFDVLYWGKSIPFTLLPWHYLPSFILITTPFIYIFWFIIGLLCFSKFFFINRLRYINTESGKQDISAFFFLIIPIIMVIGTKAIMYDGWRHLYFIYPAILYFSILGLHTAWIRLTNLKIPFTSLFKKLFIIINLVCITYISYLMVKMHPFYNVYFNILPASYTQQHFDLDYWGLSYRKGFEHIMDNDKRPKVKIATNGGWLGVNNQLILPWFDRERISFVSKEEAEYFVTEYRFHPQDYTSEELGVRHFSEIYNIEVNGLKILTVFKLK